MVVMRCTPVDENTAVLNVDRIENLYSPENHPVVLQREP